MLEQELRGIEARLIVANELGLKNIAIGSDSSIAANIIAGKNEKPWYHKNLVKSIKICVMLFIESLYITVTRSPIALQIG